MRSHLGMEKKCLDARRSHRLLAEIAEHDEVGIGVARAGDRDPFTVWGEGEAGDCHRLGIEVSELCWSAAGERLVEEGVSIGLCFP
jgi:hypothetical protein